MSIHIHSEHFYYKHKNADQTIDWLRSVILKEKKIPGEINIVFTGDKELRKMNHDYLKHDYYTDVISFEYNIEKSISGDIFISFDRIIDNSKMLGIEKIDEVNRVMVHGLLHLLGYRDKTESEKRTIREKEDYYLGKIVTPKSK